jgi:hypothetical protein
MLIDAELLARATRFCESLAASSRPGGHGDGDLEESQPMPEEGFFRRARASRPVKVARVERGQVWVVAPPVGTAGVRALALVTQLDGTSVQGLVVSEEAWLARDVDVVLGGGETPTSTALCVILDRPVAVPRSGLLTFVGALPPATWQRLHAVVAAWQRGATMRFVRWVERGQLVGARSAARRLALLAAETGDRGPLQWLAGEPVIDDDPRLEALDALAEATRWMAIPTVVTERAPEPAAPVFDRMVARIGALIASLPAMPALAPAAGFGALAGATRGAADERVYSRSFRVSLDPETIAEVRLSLDGARMRAGAHFSGPAGEPRPDARLTIRNTTTGESVARRADSHGVVLPVSLTFRDEEGGELSLSRGAEGDPEAVRLAF